MKIILFIGLVFQVAIVLAEENATTNISVQTEPPITANPGVRPSVVEVVSAHENRQKRDHQTNETVLATTAHNSSLTDNSTTVQDARDKRDANTLDHQGDMEVIAPRQQTLNVESQSNSQSSTNAPHVVITTELPLNIRGQAKGHPIEHHVVVGGHEIQLGGHMESPLARAIRGVTIEQASRVTVSETLQKMGMPAEKQDSDVNPLHAH